MIFKDKEIINILLSIERKLDMLIALNKTNKIKKAIGEINKGENK